jgi:hypothetical protein
MRARSLVALVCVVGLEGVPHAAQPKETVKLTISWPGLPQSIEVTDPPALALANVFSGAFIGTPATEPDPAWPRYAVAFDVQTLERVKMAYVVYYSRDRWTGKAFVYLPGPGENWYRLNISTIIRDGQDGLWHRALAAWSDAIDAHLPSKHSQISHQP